MQKWWYELYLVRVSYMEPKKIFFFSYKAERGNFESSCAVLPEAEIYETLSSAFLETLQKK